MGGVEVSSLVVGLQQHQGERARVPFLDGRRIGHELMHHIQFLLDKPVERIDPAYTGYQLDA